LVHSNERKKIDIIMGSRPDIIKLYPVYNYLCNSTDFSIRLILSGQHKDMADDALDAFHIRPDVRIPLDDFDRMNLSYMTGSLIRKFSDLFVYEDNTPDMVIVHGDVVTAFTAAIAAFYNKISISHVEAGLRASRFESPHPEEGIRRMISGVTTLHFAPTQGSYENLVRENVDPYSIYVTGNTVIDSITNILCNSPSDCMDYLLTDYKRKISKTILVTCHRRESWGEPLEKLCDTIKSFVIQYPEIVFIWPVHGNPQVSSVVHRKLGGVDGIILTGPLPYRDFVSILDKVDLLITDSGGVVEESSYLNIPTLILRNEIERPEALILNNVEIIGYDFALLRNMLVASFNMQKGEKTTIFGDGYAGKRIGEAIVRYLEKGTKNEKIAKGKKDPLVNYTLLPWQYQ
jgi:UDP-N-acetylglucosamine 2-epimerase (non-hydrolysing)